MSVCRVNLQRTLRPTIDIAVAIAVRTDATATDGNGGCTIHRSHGTTAIDTAQHMAAVDVQCTRSTHATTHGVEVFVST